jgi:bacteriocin biosynthesis cyclodehydratase domain-containing protein
MAVALKSIRRPFHVLAVGQFGESASAILKGLLSPVVVTSSGAGNMMNPSLWPDARLHMVVAWRPVPKVANLVNRLCFARHTPFVVAAAEEPGLIVGPAVVPGLSACYECFEQRVLQHCPRPQVRTALHRDYDLNPQSGPKGYLSVFCDLAAVRLAQVAREVETAPHHAAGRVWWFDMMRRHATIGRVVGVHGCRWCGLGRDERKRSYAAMRAELDRLFESTTVDKPDRSAGCQPG